MPTVQDSYTSLVQKKKGRENPSLPVTPWAHCNLAHSILCVVVHSCFCFYFYMHCVHYLYVLYIDTMFIFAFPEHFYFRIEFCLFKTVSINTL